MAQTTVALLMLTSALTGGLAQTAGTPRTQPDLTPVKSQTAASVPASSTTPVTSAAAPRSATGPNLRACYDGTCRLTLSKPVKFRVSPRFGVTRLSVSFGPDSVRVKATGSGVSSQVLLGAGASGSVNSIGVRVVTTSSSKAVLSISPVR
ncbi:hypothetical protein OHA77_00895 [Streptosporangium sp. NBC_01639]|uniref:hypothetical protein n=1 Tax=Streptosporangium sp. NBC_01639 TaxID=2975948 RepID=UPI0038683CC1|nr:hypothetical protein OHA77_00895 [Streptosporangium sp. NBC_01639]